MCQPSLSIPPDVLPSLIERIIHVEVTRLYHLERWIFIVGRGTKNRGALVRGAWRIAHQCLYHPLRQWLCTDREQQVSREACLVEFVETFQHSGKVFCFICRGLYLRFYSILGQNSYLLEECNSLIHLVLWFIIAIQDSLQPCKWIKSSSLKNLSVAKDIFLWLHIFCFILVSELKNAIIIHSLRRRDLTSM